VPLHRLPLCTNSRMTLCDVTHAYTDTSGGIRTYIDAKRRFIAENTDWEHLLVIPGAEDRVERDGRLTTVRIRGPLIPGAAPYRLLLSPNKVHRALTDARPDLVELTSFYTSPLMALRYRKAARKAGHRCVVVGNYVTDIPSAYVEPVAQKIGGSAIGRWAKHLTARTMRALFDRLDLVITISPQHARMLEAIGTKPPVVFKPLGVDVDLFHPARRQNQIRARYGASTNDLLLVYAGRLDAEKRALALVDALDRIPDALRARLILVGEGPHREELERRARVIAERVGEPRLFVQGYEDDPSKLADLLASCDIYATAGPYETFGLSVVEAQAAGLPVVGVANGALIERVVPGTGLLGPVDDADAMAENVLAVAKEPKTMGEAARRHVVNELSWDASLRGIFDAYSRVTSMPPLEAAEVLKPA